MDKNMNTAKKKAGAKPKPIHLKKIQVQVYQPLYIIDFIGGIDEARKLAAEAIEQAYLAKKKLFE